MADHGGNIYAFADKIEHDFSVNLNPLGPMPEIMEAAALSLHNITNYPDPYCSQLRTALAEKINEALPSSSVTTDMISFGNGAAELITVLCRALSAKNKRRSSFLIPAPGFSEYEKGVKAAGCTALFYSAAPSEDQCHDQSIPDIPNDLLAAFICNPANPTGRLTDPASLNKLLEKCKKAGAYLIVDECFLTLTDLPCGSDTCLPRSMVGYLSDNPNLIIIRSFTKTFAIPGLRLGYTLCCDRSLNETVNELLPCWNISVPAQAAGAAALSRCDSYLKESRRIISAERSFLIDELKKDEYASLIRKVYPSDTCFILFECYVNLCELLLPNGILIRDCSGFRNLAPNTYRIAVKSHEENLCLLAAIRELTAP